MLRRLPINQDVAAGLLFLAIGAIALYVAQDYRMGTALRMGPGYMPRLLSWALIVFGAAITVRGVLRPAEKLTAWHIRPLILVLAGLIVFGLLIEDAGLLVTAIAASYVGAIASREFRPGDTLVLAIC